jgi:hypothetical protein
MFDPPTAEQQLVLDLVSQIYLTRGDWPAWSWSRWPCGEERPECSFSGTSLNRSEYIEPERGAIFGRLGMRPTNWTMVGIISRFAPEEVTELATPAGDFNRTAIETMTTSLMDRIEALGLSAAPAFPGIAVTPIALYGILPWALVE